MGDESSAGAELPCTEPNELPRLLREDERASCTQAQIETPVSTAPALTESILMDTAETEVPTSPVTPSRMTVEYTNPLANEADTESGTYTPAVPSTSHTKTRLPPAQNEGTASAGRPRCAICGADLTAVDCSRRVDHFNRCWSKHCNAIVHKHSDANHQTVADRQTEVCILCSMVLDNLASIDAFEHHISCLQNQVQLPTSCPRCAIFFAVNSVLQNLVRIAEHLYVCCIQPEDQSLAELQSNWCERQNKRRHPGSCAFCSKSLTNLDAVDALYHHQNCFERIQPAYCPICCAAFPCLSIHCALEDILWHVHNCQRDNKLSIVDKYYHRQLCLRLAGRTRLILSLCSLQITGVSTIGPRKNWGYKEHAKSYRRKLAAARENWLGLYLAPNTNLRAAATYTENDRTTLVRSVDLTAADGTHRKLFCRSPYCVFSILMHGKMNTLLGGEYEAHEVVYDRHEELEAPNDPKSCTTPPTLNNGRVRRTHSQASDLVGERTSCGLTRSLAVHTARRNGGRLPPGFESDVREPEVKPGKESSFGGVLMPSECQMEGDPDQSTSPG